MTSPEVEFMEYSWCQIRLKCSWCCLQTIDLALLSSTVRGLQNQQNLLYESSRRLGLEVNTDKSKIMVFRKEGHLSSRENWYLGEQTTEIVCKYKYLGFNSSTMLSRYRGVCFSGKEGYDRNFESSTNLWMLLVFSLFQIVWCPDSTISIVPVSYTHLRAHETG